MKHPRRKLINAVFQAAHAATMPESERRCEPPPSGPHAQYIPNVPVRTHLGETARFYDDLILGKIVLINCISTRDETSCSHIETLAQTQRLIGDELGRSVFMYSITRDPAHDTPAVLRAFAEERKVRDGWLFLTGEDQDLQLLRQRLFIYSGGQDCSMHLIRYGNESVGLWGGVMANASAKTIAERVALIMPGEEPTGPPTRGGPPVLEWEA